MSFHPQNKRRAFVLVKVISNEFSVAVKLILLLAALFFASFLGAQPCINSDTTGAPTVMSPGRRPVPYPHVREADVMWSKRIWRTIDLREKMNHPYYYPEVPHNGLISLFDLIKCSLLSGTLNAFDNPAFDDEFKVKMSAEQVAALLEQREVIDMEDAENPGTFRRDTIVTETTGADIMAYWIKEDWFFDKQRSVMDVRILGICPLAAKRDPSTNEVLGYKPLFWIYFPQLRPIISRQRAFIGSNYSLPLTFEDMFQKRIFQSYVHKESNVYDRPINGYANGMDALLEADRVKEDIRNFENDLWHY